MRLGEASDQRRRRGELARVASRPSAMDRCVLPRRADQRHNAGCLGSEVEILYPFHPRCGVSVVVACKRRGGKTHFVIRQPDATLTLLPAWMAAPAAASFHLKAEPRLPVDRLLEARLLVDALLASSSRESPIGEEAVMADASRRQAICSRALRDTAAFQSKPISKCWSSPRCVSRSSRRAARSTSPARTTSWIAHDRDEDVRVAHLASLTVKHWHRVAGIVDKQFLAPPW